MVVNDHVRFTSSFNVVHAIFGLMIMLSYSLFSQIQESNEARSKFSNAKSISSAQFFGDQIKPGDREAQISLQKYSVCLFVETYLSGKQNNLYNDLFMGKFLMPRFSFYSFYCSRLLQLTI